MEPVDARIPHLERSLRRLRVALALLTLAVLALLVMAAAPAAPDELRARRIVLLGSEGRPVLVAEPGPAGAGRLMLSDAHGSPLITVGALPGGDGAVQVYNKDGQLIVDAGGALGDGHLALLRRTGRPLFQARSEYGNATVRVFDRDGELGANVMARVGAGNGGGVHVYTPGGRLAAALRTDTDGGGLVVAYGSEGREAALTPR